MRVVYEKRDVKMVERWGVLVGEEFSSFLGAKTPRDILRSHVTPVLMCWNQDISSDSL